MLETLLDSLFPRRCPVCHQIVQPGGQLCCPACLLRFSFVEEPSCKKCGKEIESFEQEYCYDCVKRPHHFIKGFALLNYNEVARESILKFKNQNCREYADFYADAIMSRYGTEIKMLSPDCLIPVPLYPQKRRRRGYNQSQVLANKLGRILQIPVNSHLLIRSRNTPSQKKLSRTERFQNLLGAFSVVPKKKMPQRVMLIDDIYTTGSTMEACAAALNKADIMEVYFLCLAIAYRN